MSERSGLFQSYLLTLGRPSLLLGYLSASWFIVLNSKSFRDKKADDPETNWLFFFLKAATFFQLLGFVPFLTKGADQGVFNFTFIIINCLFFLIILTFIIHRPKILYGYLLVAVKWNAKPEGSAEILSPAPLASKKAALPDDQLAEHSESMRKLMDGKKPYLKADFQIIDLAGELNIPVHKCSFIINNLIGKNFRDWINGYRVSFFIDRYTEKSDKMTIEAIAFESGFKSLGTFYNAFKKETGLMPTSYFSQKTASEAPIFLE